MAILVRRSTLVFGMALIVISATTLFVFSSWTASDPSAMTQRNEVYQTSPKEGRREQRPPHTVFPTNYQQLHSPPNPDGLPCYVPDGWNYCAPHFIIAGCMKAGTTSLWAYLMRHPQVMGLNKTEVLKPTVISAKSPVKQNDPLRGTGLRNTGNSLKNSVVPVSSPRGNPKNRVSLKQIIGAKEVRFFVQSEYKQIQKWKGSEKASLEWYLDIFPRIPPPNTRIGTFAPDIEANRGRVCGEASPMYIKSDWTAETIKKTLPEAKIIVLLREPVSRAFSEYLFLYGLKYSIKDWSKPTESSRNRSSSSIPLRTMEEHQEQFRLCSQFEQNIMDHCEYTREDGKLPSIAKLKECERNYIKVLDKLPVNQTLCENAGFRQCVRMPSKKYTLACSSARSMIRNGAYAVQLAPWMKIYGPNQLLVLRSEELYANTASVLDRVTEFLGLKPFDWQSAAEKAFNIDQERVFDEQKKKMVTKWTIREDASTNTGTKGSKYEPLWERTRNDLEAFYEPYHADLERLLGKQIVWKEEPVEGVAAAGG